MKGRERLHESSEDYIETIYIIEQKRGSVRSIDVAMELGFSRPSVSRAVGILKKEGLLYVEPDGTLKLTEEGRKKAQGVYEKHTILTRFLMITAGIDEDTAENDACRIEHVISNDTFKGIKEFVASSGDKT